ncbi:MAG: hypothetical protein RMM31_04670 [Anaerolineae bacterium]|nr:hypothetical protein [Anaerolineae bacterium]
MLDWLKRLFRSSPCEQDDALIYYVKGYKCGAITRLRIDRYNELSRDDDDTLFVRKTVVDSKCFGRVEVFLRFDSSYREISREIEGGEFVTREAWEAQQRAAHAASLAESGKG